MAMRRNGGRKEWVSEISSDSVKGNIPESFLCPISLCLMEDPVTAPSGITYERSCLQTWLNLGHRTCPVTMSVIGAQPPLIPNQALLALIRQWQYSSLRQSSPPPPPSLLHSLLHSPPPQRLPSLQRLRRLLLSGDISHSSALSSSLLALLTSDPPHDLPSQDESVETLSLLRLSSSDLASIARSAAAMAAVKRVLGKGSESGAAMVEKMARETEIDANDAGELARGLMAMVVAEEEGGRRMRAALAALAAMAVQEGTTKEALVREMAAQEGVMAALIELLAGAQRSRAEKLLTLISTACLCSHHARTSVSGHALAIPVLVRSLLVYSDLANEMAISTLWSLICHGQQQQQQQQQQQHQHLPSSHHNHLQLQDDSSPALQASQLGVAKKLLVLAQMDCTLPTKRRITDLLKHLSRLRDHRCPQSQLLHYNSSSPQRLLLL